VAASVCPRAKLGKNVEELTKKRIDARKPRTGCGFLSNQTWRTVLLACADVASD
jgi:hypothetical protein